MSDLPSREKFNKEFPDAWPVGWRDVLAAFASGELMTAAEWRDTIDREAMKNTFWDHAADLLLPLGDSTAVDRALNLALAAAIGDTE